MTPCSFQHLTIIGLGLIGGSLAMAARERYPELTVRGVDILSETLQYALRHHIVDEVSLHLPETFEANHLVVLASHLSENQSHLQKLATTVLGKNIQVLDVGSCKRNIVRLGETLLPHQFVGGNPVVNAEEAGIQHATSLLFAGKSFVLCPHEGFPSASLTQIQQFIQGMGALPRLMTADKHDQHMAYVSHFPQLYSLLLSQLLYAHEPGHLLRFHGLGIEGQLRLTGGSYPMWQDIFRENQDHLQGVMEEFVQLLRSAGNALDTPTLGEWFTQANRLYQEFHQVRITDQQSIR